MKFFEAARCKRCGHVQRFASPLPTVLILMAACRHCVTHLLEPFGPELQQLPLGQDASKSPQEAP